MSSAECKGYVQLSSELLAEILKAFSGHHMARRFAVVADPVPINATISGVVTDGDSVRIYFNNCERRQYMPQLETVFDPEPILEYEPGQDAADVDAVVHSTGESNVTEGTGHNPEDSTGKQQRRKRR